MGEECDYVTNHFRLRWIGIQLLFIISNILQEFENGHNRQYNLQYIISLWYEPVDVQSIDPKWLPRREFFSLQGFSEVIGQYISVDFCVIYQDQWTTWTEIYSSTWSEHTGYSKHCSILSDQSSAIYWSKRDFLCTLRITDWNLIQDSLIIDLTKFKRRKIERRDKVPPTWKHSIPASTLRFMRKRH